MHTLTKYRLFFSGAFLLAVVGTYRLSPNSSAAVEKYFSNGIFSCFRSIWDPVLRFCPIPFLYILIVLLFLFLLYRYRLLKYKPIHMRLKSLIVDLICLTFILISFFYLFWGFNYKRPSPIAEWYDPGTEMSESKLLDAYCRVGDSLAEIRSVQLLDSIFLPATEDELRDELLGLYEKMDYPYHGRVRVRKLYPKGLLLRFSTAGIYLPFTGEGHIDPGLHPISWPFTMLHEMSHGYGWTSEELCNFLALLACVNSRNPRIKYSGYFSWWRYLRGNALRVRPDLLEKPYDFIHPLVLKDYREILKYQEAYPDLIPRLRDLIYDNYLKSHGIPEGLQSYSQIIRLAQQWEEMNGSLLFNN